MRRDVRRYFCDQCGKEVEPETERYFVVASIEYKRDPEAVLDFCGEACSLKWREEHPP